MIGSRVGWRQTVQGVDQLWRGLEPGAGYKGQAAELGGDRMETEARELGHRRATRGSGGDPNVVQQLRKLSDCCCDSLVRFGSVLLLCKQGTLETHQQGKKLSKGIL